MRHSIVKREDRLAILMHDVNYMRQVTLLLVYTCLYILSTIFDRFFVKSLQHLFDLICGTIEKI